METNIVEVENFVQQSEERRGSAFTQEVKRYLERYPNTQYVDVLLTDLMEAHAEELALLETLDT
ncbi:glutamine synthetase, partial [Escherichia sp. TWPC-MK]